MYDIPGAISNKEFVDLSTGGIFNSLFFWSFLLRSFVDIIIIIIVYSSVLKMGDHFVLLVDRLLTESTLDATIGSMNPSYNAEDSSSTSETTTVKDSSPTRRSVDGSSVGQLVQCRICHDDDEDSNMEAPCSCCGSLKYAHRKCVQRWCNEKGDTVCEICLQQFKPGYTAPPQLFHIGGVPMNFRGNNWEISRRHDLDNPGLLFARDRSNSDSTYNYYSSSTATSVFYCRSVAVIFMVLLVLRHTLPIIVSGEENYSFAIFAILLLRIFGILVPIYVMARALSLFHCSRQRRQQETRELQVATSDDEHVIPPPPPPQQLQPPPHLIHIQ